MSKNLNSLLKPGPRLSGPEPAHYEEVVPGGLTLEDRLTAEEREELLEGPLFGYRIQLTPPDSTPMRRTMEYQERQFRDGQRTAAIVWGSVLAAFILGAIFS